jgi:hypothetical protein
MLVCGNPVGIGTITARLTGERSLFSAQGMD